MGNAPSVLSRCLLLLVVLFAACCCLCALYAKNGPAHLPAAVLNAKIAQGPLTYCFLKQRSPESRRMRPDTFGRPRLGGLRVGVFSSPPRGISTLAEKFLPKKKARNYDVGLQILQIRKRRVFGNDGGLLFLYPLPLIPHNSPFTPPAST